MKRTILLLSALLLLASCDMTRTETYVDDLVVPLEEGSSDSLFFSVSLEYVVTGMKVEYRQALNGTIVSQAFDLEDGGGSLEEVAIRYRENLIDEYMNENAVLESGVRTWEDHLEGAFQDQYKGWKNYRITYYSFRGGAHGIQTVTNTVFDAKTGSQLTEADLFAPGYEAPVAALIQASIQASMEKEDPELLQLVNLEAAVPNGNFGLHEEGVEWIYQPYEVGPYALGIVTATIPWEDLKPYLK